MDWIARVNCGPGVISIGGRSVEIHHWAHAFHLPDNQPHRHTFYEICLVGRHGRGIFTNLADTYELFPGDLFIARPGALHQIINTESPEMELYWVSVLWPPDHDRSDLQAPSEAASLLQGFAESEVVYVRDAQPVTAIWQALRSIAQGPAASDSEIEYLAGALLAAIARSVTSEYDHCSLPQKQSDLQPAIARRAIRYISDNLDRPLSVPELASYLCVSPRHLSRLFEEFAGTSPAAYIAHARLDRAASLLRSTQRPVKEIAMLVGYPDIHHFTRRFRHYWGSPPGEYRREQPARLVPNVQKPGGLV